MKNRITIFVSAVSCVLVFSLICGLGIFPISKTGEKLNTVSAVSYKNEASGAVSEYERTDDGSELTVGSRLYDLIFGGGKDKKSYKDMTSEEKTVIDSISRCVNPYKDYQAFLDLAKNPDFRCWQPIYE